MVPYDTNGQTTAKLENEIKDSKSDFVLIQNASRLM